MFQARTLLHGGALRLPEAARVRRGRRGHLLPRHLGAAARVRKPLPGTKIKHTLFFLLHFDEQKHDPAGRRGLLVFSPLTELAVQ